MAWQNMLIKMTEEEEKMRSGISKRMRRKIRAEFKKRIYSYEESEQQRLVAQAEFLAPYTHPFLTFAPTDLVLEIGCGVGAQIKIILDKENI